MDMPRCTVPGCYEEAEGRCESCDAPRCEDHSRINADTGGLFCTLRDDAAELARKGRYERTTWCSA